MEDLENISLEDIFTESASPLENNVAEVVNKLLETKRMNTDLSNKYEAMLLSLLETYAEINEYDNIKFFIEIYREHLVAINRKGRKEVIDFSRTLRPIEQKLSLKERLFGGRL